MASELKKLIDSNSIRVLDLVMIMKDQDGSVEASERHDAERSMKMGLFRETEAIGPPCSEVPSGVVTGATIARTTAVTGATTGVTGATTAANGVPDPGCCDDSSEAKTRRD